MNCPGLHCPGCGDGDAKAIAAGGSILAGMLAVEWVAAHAVEVLAVTATCGALAVAAVVALMRWGDRRERRHMAERPFLVSRTEPATLTATVIPQVTQGTQPQAIETHYHIHLDPADHEAARIIRTAIPGIAEDTLTERNDHESPAQEGRPWRMRALRRPGRQSLAVVRQGIADRKL